MIWEAIVYFKVFLRITEVKHLENEAIASTRIGKSYSYVLKMEKKPHPYHFQSIKIALALMCAWIASSEWYIYSFEALKNAHMNGVSEETGKELPK